MRAILILIALFLATPTGAQDPASELATLRDRVATLTAQIQALKAAMPTAPAKTRQQLYAEALQAQAAECPTWADPAVGEANGRPVVLCVAARATALKGRK